ncbi:MAG TPA: DEAD/DEAH box helicase [Candidatus Hydrogenedentes bacterium]|nr:DEAD/DEAH box helicase [Candidatus Hydrogenedentota bacterium]HIJ72719.1 DEAD/DEAH box helicase [Candidatus Hydrogenedentota bacterium]
MTFEEFDIDPRCLDALDAQGVVEATPIQAQMMPIVLAGRDVIAVAEPGADRTLAFALPLLTRMAAGPLAPNMMLVLVPTPELALEAHAVIETFGRPLGIRCVCIRRAEALETETRALRRGWAIVVATPDRLVDHIERGNIRFNHLMILVLDEADRLFAPVFLPAMRRILKKLPEERQAILCAATFPAELARWADAILDDPERIPGGGAPRAVDTVRQTLYGVQRDGKMSLLTRLLRERALGPALILTRTRARADRVTRALRKAGFKAQAIHAHSSERQREQILDGFREGRCRMIIATEAAAEELDIEELGHVINYDMPESPEDYIHRVGRAAHAGPDVISLVCPDEHDALERIEDALGRRLPRAEWEEAQPLEPLFRPHVRQAPRIKNGVTRRPAGLRHRR